MKVISWNIRGLGHWKKRVAIKEFLQKAGPDIVLLQETKLQEVNLVDVRSIGKSRSKDWVFLPSCGKSRGILIMWDCNFASKVEDILGYFSVSVLLDIRGRGEWWVSSVNGPPRPYGHSSFFEEIGNLWGYYSPRWLVGSDFNVVRFPGE